MRKTITAADLSDVANGDFDHQEALALARRVRLANAAEALLAALLPLVKASPVNGGMIRFDGDELAAARAAIALVEGA